MDDILVQPCEFRKAVFMHPNLKGYWVRLYVLATYCKGVFETHTFLHQSEWLDNYQLLLEMDMPVSNHSYEVLVTEKNSWREIYNQIEDYVSSTNND